MMAIFKRNSVITRERDQHILSRANIDPDAVKVLYRLVNAGYTAYLVGGSVRDLLLGRTPNDFDISTDARPNQIKRLFRNCFLIGRRFRLAHIIFGRKVIETSTFRKQPLTNGDANGLYQSEDNTFGTPSEDAKRRDFTVNGLFYDIQTFQIIDYVGGLKDLEKRVIRSIGDPNVRFQEDPVRMMRAIKFASRLNFTIHRACSAAITRHRKQICNASPARVCEETFRTITHGATTQAFQMLWRLKLLEELMPELYTFINTTGKNNSPLWRYLENFDALPEAAALTNATKLACLYYPLLQKALESQAAERPLGFAHHHHLAAQVLHAIKGHLAIPKNIIINATNALEALSRLDHAPRKGRNLRFLGHPLFQEVLILKRIICRTEGLAEDHLAAWESLHNEQAPRLQTRRKRRRRPQKTAPNSPNPPQES